MSTTSIPDATLPAALAERLAQIETAAQARGCNVSPGRVQSPRPVLPPRPAPSAGRNKSVSAWQARIHRPLPRAWAKPIEAIAGAEPWQQRERQGRLASVELRLAVKLIAVALGPDWRAGWPEEFSHHWALIHRPSGAVVSVSHQWNDYNRLRFYAINVMRRDALPSVITVSAARTPASIAADLTRRLIDVGVVAQHEQVQAHKREFRARWVECRRAILAVAKALGTRVAADKTNHAIKRWRYGHSNENDGWPPDSITDVEACYEYDKLVLTVATLDVELAVAIARLIAERCPESVD